MSPKLDVLPVRQPNDSEVKSCSLEAQAATGLTGAVTLGPVGPARPPVCCPQAHFFPALPPTPQLGSSGQHSPICVDNHFN